MRITSRIFKSQNSLMLKMRSNSKSKQTANKRSKMSRINIILLFNKLMKIRMKLYHKNSFRSNK